MTVPMLSVILVINAVMVRGRYQVDTMCVISTSKMVTIGCFMISGDMHEWQRVNQRCASLALVTGGKVHVIFMRWISLLPALILKCV